MFYHNEFRSLDFCLCRQSTFSCKVNSFRFLFAILPYCMSLTSKCRHVLIGNQNTVDNTFTPLQLKDKSETVSTTKNNKREGETTKNVISSGNLVSNAIGFLKVFVQ